MRVVGEVYTEYKNNIGLYDHKGVKDFEYDRLSYVGKLYENDTKIIIRNEIEGDKAEILDILKDNGIIQFDKIREEYHFKKMPEANSCGTDEKDTSEIVQILNDVMKLGIVMGSCTFSRFEDGKIRMSLPYNVKLLSGDKAFSKEWFNPDCTATLHTHSDHVKKVYQLHEKCIVTGIRLSLPNYINYEDVCELIKY